MSEKVVSPEERAFLDAILDEPDDDTPRLVYADWLTERGDPRGEFIQVQCRLARLDENDPDLSRLSRRQQELLRSHRPLWERPYRSFRFINHVGFSRGFLDLIYLSVRDFCDQGEALYRVGPVEHVRLRSPVYLHDFQSREASGHPFSRVTSLSMTKGAFFDRDLRTILGMMSLDRLSRLDVSSNKLSLSALNVLLSMPSLPRLSELKLAGCLTSSQRAAQIDSLGERNLHERLTVLDLSRNGLTDRCLDGLIRSSRLRSLRSLVLEDNRNLRGVTIAGLLTAPGLTSLKSLHLGGCSRVSEGIDALLSIDPAPTLGILVLSDTRLNDDAVAILANSPALADLRMLDLRLNRVRDFGAKALADSPHLGRLRLLDLRGCQLSPPSRDALRERFGEIVKTN